MSKWLNYHHLYYFYIIAQNGSIAKASAELLVGQPALSSQLKQLEENLGHKLFERKNRSLILTQAGIVALNYAEEIFNKGDELLSVFNDSSLLTKREYRIGVVDSIPKSVSCKLIEKAKIIGKDSYITVIESGTRYLVEKILTHDLDIALSNTPPSTEYKELLIKSVGISRIAAYSSEKYSALKSGFPYSLNDQPVILLTGQTKLRADIEHYYTEQNINYDLIASVQDSSLKKQLACNDKGIIFLPEFAGRQLVRDKKLVKLGVLSGLTEEYWLLYAKKTIRNPVSEKLVQSFIV